VCVWGGGGLKRKYSGKIQMTNLSGLMRPVDLHLPVESIVQQKIVRHTHPVGLHGVALYVKMINYKYFQI